MKTDPALIAFRTGAEIPTTSAGPGRPCARLKKARYVGALSRKLDSITAARGASMFPSPFRPVRMTVQQVEDPDYHARRAQPKGPQIPDRPEERHPLEVPEEQGRVPDRCKQPPDVGHHEDVEDDDVGPFLPAPGWRATAAV